MLCNSDNDINSDEKHGDDEEDDDSDAHVSSSV